VVGAGASEPKSHNPTASTHFGEQTASAFLRAPHTLAQVCRMRRHGQQRNIRILIIPAAAPQLETARSPTDAPATRESIYSGMRVQSFQHGSETESEARRRTSDETSRRGDGDREVSTRRPSSCAPTYKKGRAVSSKIRKQTAAGTWWESCAAFAGGLFTMYVSNRQREAGTGKLEMIRTSQVGIRKTDGSAPCTS
jgi:hypothetical protein